ncbi:MAG TPA: hypothetical protein VIG46_12625 [Candidatus Baltobacteraceae bacterium]|jgi:hypothetical protein
MRYPSIAIALAIAVSLGCTTVAQAAPCKGSLTYGFFYAKRVGGGYLEYINAIHNATAKPLTFTLHVWGLRAPDSAKAAKQTLKVGAGATVDVGVAYTTSQYFGQSGLRRLFDTSATTNFPTLSLTDCTH